MIAGLVVWVTGEPVAMPWVLTADRLSEDGAPPFEFTIGFTGVIAFGIVCAVAAVLFNRRSHRLESATRANTGPTACPSRLSPTLFHKP